jgi:deazaflavin-dependent oxidoreductase (nitroreductase family)
MPEVNDFNQTIINEFRANHGIVGGGFAGASVVLLTTRGAKSGRVRTNPLVGLPRDDGTIYVFASAAGSPKHPAWYHNILAHPAVEVEYGDSSFRATATPITGPDRDQIYAEQAARMPGFADYEAKTERVIPVIALVRET